MFSGLRRDDESGRRPLAEERRKAGHYEILGETCAKFEFFENGWNPHSRFLDVDNILARDIGYNRDIFIFPVRDFTRISHRTVLPRHPFLTPEAAHSVLPGPQKPCHRSIEGLARVATFATGN